MDDIRQTQAWAMALENMAQMHPRYLVELLETRELDRALMAKVKLYANLLTRLEERMPGATPEERQEIAQAEYLTPVNPNWQEEEPLTPEERKKLEEYLKGLELSPSNANNGIKSPEGFWQVALAFVIFVGGVLLVAYIAKNIGLSKIDHHTGQPTDYDERYGY